MKSKFWFLVVIGIFVIAIGAGVWLTLPQNHDASPIAPPASEELDGPALFEDVTSRTGIDFAYRNGEEANLTTILESLGGGVAAFDYDGDDLIDLFFTGGGSLTDKMIRGRPGKLYKNLGGWMFQDVTDQTGLTSATNFYSHGVAVADFDCDGYRDLLVTGWKRVVLLHNIPNGSGGRTFEDVTSKAGIGEAQWATSAAWGDLDGDGFPDLYVCQYVDWSFENDPVCATTGIRDVCAPQRFKPIRHLLYRNKRDGTFENVTDQASLRPDGKGLGVVMLDLDADRKPEIYVANDASNNFLYRNLDGFRLEERGSLSGVATDDSGLYNGSMGVDAADFDGSGRPSLFVTNFQGEIHALYLNLGSHRFRHHSQAAGLGRFGRSYVGFGTAFTDFDGDGWEDLVVMNGHVLRYPAGSTYRQLPIFLHNERHEGRRQFRQLPGRGGAYFRSDHVGRGLAVADLDQDGWPDLIVSHQNDPVTILRNVAGDTLGAGNHRLMISLHGKNHRDLVGTTLSLEVDGRILTRFVKGGGSYLSQSDHHIDFGLGRVDHVGPLTVSWSYGRTEVFSNLKVDQDNEILEGSGKPQ